MKSHFDNGGARWLSLHVFLTGSIEEFLIDFLLPMLREERQAGRVKRFFFIRYSEGGLHLRLRFLPARGVSVSVVERCLRELVRRFAIESGSDPRGCVVQQHSYDRANLYFGESLLSVYAELLNEQTSYLGLKLLSANYNNRPRLALTLTAALGRLLHRSVKGQQDFVRALDESRHFAEETAAKFGFVVPPTNEKFEQALCEGVFRVFSRTAPTLDQDKSARHIIRLLQRTRKVVPSGDFVATHALHLFCNKLGFSIAEEKALFGILHRLAVNSSSFP